MRTKEKDNLPASGKFLKSRILPFFLIPVALALAIGIFEQMYYRYEIKNDVDKLAGEEANLKKQKEDLGKLIDYYQNKANLESEARVRLNMKKEGENTVVVLPEAATTASDAGSKILSADEIERLPNYRQWWYYFFGK